jgi:REP element-mobilizing transposase RayT
MDYFKQQRKSFIEIGKIYFFTATINNWMKMLEEDKAKQIVVDSLQYLSDNRKINVYGFVLMPNHIHLIWQTLELYQFQQQNSPNYFGVVKW